MARRGALTLSALTLFPSPLSHRDAIADSARPFPNRSIATYTAVHLTLSWIFLKLCQKVFFKITDENKDSESRGRSPWKDGAELAFWDTAAALLQVWGVTLTSAVHAGVIICLATGFVPILSWGIIKQKPKAAEIAGCTSALGGAVLLALDGTSVSATGELLSNGSIVGDGLTALSALFYAVSMVRIHQKTQGDSGREVSSTKLAVDKVFFAASFGWLWLLGELSYYHLFGAGSGTYRVWENILSPEQWILILFISVGPSALSNVLQVRDRVSIHSIRRASERMNECARETDRFFVFLFSQFKALSRINPSEAQILLSTVPIWALSFSILTGGPTLLGGKALAGLMMICFSSLLTWLL